MAYINNITVGEEKYSLALSPNSVGSGLTLTEIGESEENKESVLSVNLGKGLTFDANNKITFKIGSGLDFFYDNDEPQLETKIDTSYFTYWEGSLRLNLGSGLLASEQGGVYLNLGSGLHFNGKELSIDCWDGLDYYTVTDGYGNQTSKLCANLGAGLETKVRKITVKLGRGLDIDANGAICNPIQYGGGLVVNSSSNTLMVAKGRGLNFDDNDKLEIFLEPNYGDGLTFDNNGDHTYLKINRANGIKIINTNNSDPLKKYAIGIDNLWLTQFIQDTFGLTPIKK